MTTSLALHSPTASASHGLVITDVAWVDDRERVRMANLHFTFLIIIIVIFWRMLADPKLFFPQPLRTHSWPVSSAHRILGRLMGLVRLRWWWQCRWRKWLIHFRSLGAVVGGNVGYYCAENQIKDSWKSKIRFKGSINLFTSPRPLGEISFLTRVAILTRNITNAFHKKENFNT